MQGRSATGPRETMTRRRSVVSRGIRPTSPMSSTSSGPSPSSRSGAWSSSTRPTRSSPNTARSWRAYAENPSASGVLILSVKQWPANTKLAKVVDKVGTGNSCASPKEGDLATGWWPWPRSDSSAARRPDAARLLVELVGVEPRDPGFRGGEIVGLCGDCGPDHTGGRRQDGRGGSDRDNLEGARRSHDRPGRRRSNIWTACWPRANIPIRALAGHELQPPQAPPCRQAPDSPTGAGRRVQTRRDHVLGHGRSAETARAISDPPGSTGFPNGSSRPTWISRGERPRAAGRAGNAPAPDGPAPERLRAGMPSFTSSLRRLSRMSRRFASCR